jgi:hypothetical protein
MLIQNASVTFPQVSGQGPQTQSVAVNMGSPVSSAVALLTGFTAEFSNGDDHNLGQLNVSLNVPAGSISGNVVTVEVALGLRDWSGNWDDKYDGSVSFVVVGQ